MEFLLELQIGNLFRCEVQDQFRVPAGFFFRILYRISCRIIQSHPIEIFMEISNF